MASLESKEKHGQLPVYHIHGYVPYGIRRRPKYRLILTAESYRDAYRPGKFTTVTLDRFLRHFPTLFVGISFEDELLVRRIEQLAGWATTPTHFALLKKGSVRDRLLKRLSKARVQPVLYERHQEIPTILGRIYQAGLKPDDLRVRKESKSGRLTGHIRMNRREYWERLLHTKA
jgi:hypothetical protein